MSPPDAAPELKVSANFIAESFRNLRFSSRNRVVFQSMLGNSWFWFYGAVLLAQLPVYSKEYLHGDHGAFVMLLTVFSLGVGSGSLLCEKLSGAKVEIGLVPFGSIGLTIFGADLYFASNAFAVSGAALAGTAADVMTLLAHPGIWRILFDFLMIGMFGGFFIVPLFALIQLRADPAHISRTIAGMNILNALFMVAAAGMAIVLLSQGLTIPQLFLVTALLNAAVAGAQRVVGNGQGHAGQQQQGRVAGMQVVGQPGTHGNHPGTGQRGAEKHHGDQFAAVGVFGQVA